MYPKQNRILHKTNFANLLGWLEVREITKARGFGAGGVGLKVSMEGGENV